MMRGHYAYYGITGNSRRISWYARQVARIWQKWLSRRDPGSRLHWRRDTALLKRRPLPAARDARLTVRISSPVPPDAIASSSARQDDGLVLRLSKRRIGAHYGTRPSAWVINDTIADGRARGNVDDCDVTKEPHR